MRLVVAVAGLLFAAVPASAQYYGPRPAVPIGPPSAYDVAEIVQAMGLDPIGPPGRSGAFYVQRARDDFGRVLSVTVDARRSQVVAVEALGHANAQYGRYAGYGPYRRAYPGYGALPPDDELDFSAPGSIMGGARVPPHAVAPTQRSAVVTPHPATPPQAVAPKPATKSVSATPVPRKRPATAPQEAAGSVEPVQNTAPPAAIPAPAATPPVTPLE